jgi:acetyl esterase
MPCNIDAGNAAHRQDGAMRRVEKIDILPAWHWATRMTIDPDTQSALDLIKASGRPPTHTLSVAEARGLFAASRNMLAPDAPVVAVTRDLQAPGPHGGIPLRLYRGTGTPAGARLPTLVFFHGGGWVLGDLDSHDVVCSTLANDAGCCVVSVDYRMGPEDKVPAAVDDSAAAVAWIASQAEVLAIDPARLAVGGDSAGGNLAAVMALMARDGDLPALCYQLLIYPVTDLTGSQLSFQRIAQGLPLTTATMLWFREHYVRSEADHKDWRASPLHASDLAGTPPAFVLTVSHDPLADEGILYAKRLERAGVRVTHLHMSDQIHGFITMGKLVRAATTTLATMAAHMRDTFARAS